MPWYFIVFLFITSCVILSWLSSRLIRSLVQIARYLNWKEFIIAFFVVACAASLPNLLVDLNAVFHGIPELAFGDIVGGNFIDLTLVIAMAIFFSKKEISTKSEIVQKSAIFTSIIAVLPLLLILDGRMDRRDGIILLLSFAFYCWWLFSKKERFSNAYKSETQNPVKDFKSFLGNIVKVIIFLTLLLVASQAVIMSAQFFSGKLGISIALVGILIVGLGNCFPELYFSIISARKEENWLILGDLMGSVIICATLVLGIIAAIAPFEIKDFSPFLIARIFLVIGSMFALLFIRSGKKVTKKEGALLLFIYVAFLLMEIFVK